MRAPLRIAGLTATAALLTVAGAFAAATKTVVLSDAKSDVSGELDLQKASLKLASDGRLRAAITTYGKVGPRTLLAGSGPPGSVCLKIWTLPDADPAATRPDRLVCVTARTKDELRASVLGGTAPGLPKLLGSASVSLSKGERSLVVRVSQSALGRPELIRFAVESTRAGCDRVSCIDTSPDKGAVRRFRLR